MTDRWLRSLPAAHRQVVVGSVWHLTVGPPLKNWAPGGEEETVEQPSNALTGLGALIPPAGERWPALTALSLADGLLGRHRQLFGGRGNTTRVNQLAAHLIGQLPRLGHVMPGLRVLQADHTDVALGLEDRLIGCDVHMLSVAAGRGLRERAVIGSRGARAPPRPDPLLRPVRARALHCGQPGRRGAAGSQPVGDGLPRTG